MYGRILQCLIFSLLNLYIFSEDPNPNYKILSFDYGTHVEGEQVSYYYRDIVKAFTPNYELNVTPTSPGMEKRFTFMRAEYVNSLSKVIIKFNPDNFILSFHIKFPFMEMPIGVVGYSLPIGYNPHNT